MILSELRDGVLTQQSNPTVQFEAHYDLIVVGLGTAGAIALSCAAKRGLRVLGLEKSVSMGGTHTAGGVPGYYFGSPGGSYEDIDAHMHEITRGHFTPQMGNHPCAKSIVLEKTAHSYGAEFAYESVVTAVYLEKKRALGLRCVRAGKICNYSAEILMDCTGNAILCRIAGCEMQGGRLFDGKMQPFTLPSFCFQNGSFHTSNEDCGYINPYDRLDCAQKLIDTMTQPHYLKSRYAEQPFLLPASLMGVRESARIVGEETLSFADFAQGKNCPNPLFYAHSNLDNHSKDVAFESDLQIEWNTVANLFGVNFSIPVPAGALIPKGYKGILVGGRCLSSDHELASCVRMNTDMQKCGEAAAAMAYLSVRDHISLREVPYNELAQLLRSSSCLDEKNNRMVLTGCYNGTENGELHWLDNLEAIEAGLRSEQPGIAMWSARRMGVSAAEKLTQWLGDADEALKKHSALALGLMRQETALPVLRQTAAMLDPYVPKTSRKYNMFRGVSAIYLLGKLEDVSSVPLLIEILNSYDTFADLPFTPDEFVANRNEMFFQFFSFALMSLIRIGNKHRSVRSGVSVALKALQGNLPELSITLKNVPHRLFSMNEMIEAILRQV